MTTEQEAIGKYRDWLTAAADKQEHADLGTEIEGGREMTKSIPHVSEDLAWHEVDEAYSVAEVLREQRQADPDGVTAQQVDDALTAAEDLDTNYGREFGWAQPQQQEQLEAG